MPIPRRLALLVVLGLFAAVSCGDPTSPPPDAEPGAETVGPEGGTAAASDGAASLSVPAGALADPVEITVAPATMTDMGGQVPSEAFDADAGTVYGVAPIEGTIWDLQPDGLEFLTPATIVLRYEESDLPEGISEEELGVFIINGIFEQLPSSVDTDANTVTAQIEHFSFAFTAPQPGPRLDLELTSLTTSSDPRVGEPVEYAAEVRNNGPGPAVDATVLYEVGGNVVLGPVHDSCDEPTESAGDFLIVCDLPALLAGEVATAAAIELVPQESGETVTVQATALAAPEDTDIDPDNDSRAVGGSVVGEGAMVDLKAGQPQLSVDSDPRVGGLMAVVGRVDNLGPGDSHGGTLRLEAIGDVELGDVPIACTEIEGVAAAIECPVEPLEPFDLDAVGPLRVTALSAGDVELVATVTPAPEDTDVDPENDVRRLTIEVASTFLVDLEPVSTPRISGEFVPGSPITFEVRVGNYRPPSNGGTILYEAIGDVVLGEVAEGCTESAIPSGVAVVCAFDPFPGYVNDTGGFGGPRVLGWVGPFEVVAQSTGFITFSATTVPIDGDTDVNPDNDRLEREVEIVEGDAR